MEINLDPVHYNQFLFLLTELNSLQMNTCSTVSMLGEYNKLHSTYRMFYIEPDR